MPQSDEADAAATDAIATAVEAGTDDIEVPEALVEEPADEQVRAESQSLYARLLRMPIPEKIKLALRGNKDARILLARDPNRAIRRYVLENPRIGEEEVVAIVRDRQTDQETLKTIAERRQWMKLYQVRLALVKNPKTSLPMAMRLLTTLLQRDVERIAKSRDVPQGVVTQARRIVLESRRR